MNKQEALNKIKELLLDTVQHSVPEDFPELYRRGYSDGVYAAIQLIRNADLLMDEEHNDS